MITFLYLIQSDHDDDYASAAEDSIRGTSPTPSSGRSTPPRPRDRSPGQVWTLPHFLAWFLFDFLVKLIDLPGGQINDILIEEDIITCNSSQIMVLDV